MKLGIILLGWGWGMFCMDGLRNRRWLTGWLHESQRVLRPIGLAEFIRSGLLGFGLLGFWSLGAIDPVSAASPTHLAPTCMVCTCSCAMADQDLPVTEFPLPAGVECLVTLASPGNEAINFQIKGTLADAISFYRQALIAQGLREGALYTVITPQVFSLVFTGRNDGQDVVVQGVDLGDRVNINIRLETISQGV